MTIRLDFNKERRSLSKEETYVALNAYLDNAAFISSEYERSKWETWERNLKESAYINEVFNRVKKEKTQDFNKRNTLTARIDVKLNHWDNMKPETETFKQKTKKTVDRSLLYLGVGAIGAVVTAGAACGCSLLGAANGVDPQFCASVLVGGAVLGGKVLAAGGAVTTARLAVGAAFSNKGGKELMQAKEALKNLDRLETTFMLIDRKDAAKRTSLSSGKEQEKHSSLSSFLYGKDNKNAKSDLSSAIIQKKTAAQKSL